MKSKKKLVEEYIQKIISKLCYEYGASLEDARKAVEELDLLNRYKGNYDFVLYQNVSTWVNLIVDRHKKEVERENLKNKTTVEPLTKNYVDEKVEKALKELRHNRMDVQTYNKVFLPQWTTASLFIQNLQLTLEGKCDKESLRQLQIIGWNEETKKFISDVLNLYKENVLNELLRDNISNKPEKKEENTMENYIVINGKKAELTEEQLKQLGIKTEEKENPFTRKIDKSYFYISAGNALMSDVDNNTVIDIALYDNLNYFNDYNFTEQVALHQLLYRKLLKYAYDNGAEDCEWNNNNNNCHYYIYFNYQFNEFQVSGAFICKEFQNYFSNKKVAEQAIQDVIEPFMKEYPEFIW